MTKRATFYVEPGSEVHQKLLDGAFVRLRREIDNLSFVQGSEEHLKANKLAKKFEEAEKEFVKNGILKLKLEED